MMWRYKPKSMRHYISSIKLLAKRTLLVFVAYQLCRLFFYAFNRTYFPAVDAGVFLGGLLYDLSAIGFINLIFIALHLPPGQFKYHPRYQKNLKLAFFAVNLIFIATNFVDFEYYKFTGRRSSFGLITAKGMENEILGLLPSFLTAYWFLPLGFTLFAYLFWKALGTAHFETPIGKTSKSTLGKETALLLVFMSLGLIMARGGFGKKPIRIVDAVTYSEIGNSALILNTPYSILKTLGSKETLTDPKFYSPQELDKLFNPILETKPEGPAIKKNVVVLILESFGDENIHQGYTPFLDSLLTQSYYFKNGFANGKLSIDAVPSILSSIPSLMNTSIISSGYSLNEVYGLPKIMKKQGYSTSFFHGAFNGSQNFDQYCKVAGFDAYYGKNEYVGPEAFDGKWGIFDEEFLQFFAQKTSQFKQPFFTSLFTISSHLPFIIPEKYAGKFPKGTADIHETIGYTDYALRKFFARAKKEGWYSNTIFVITADHCSVFGKGSYNTPVGKFRIPLAFFDPSNPSFKGVVEKNFQQIDVLPSLLDYLNIQDKVVTYGKSFRSPKDFVVTYLDNVYNYIQGDYYLAFDGQKSIGLYNWKIDPMMHSNLLQKDVQRLNKMERFIKAYIQSFNERVIANQLIAH
jgi:phosphoglycerol transferase MdoB-like AlkP superfamily enzyme